MNELLNAGKQLDAEPFTYFKFIIVYFRKTGGIITIISGLD